jgi:isopenicillin N synthase-like dioxygenase
MAAETKDFSSIPAISIAGLGRDAAATERFVAEIGRACESAGFFYVVDHGVRHDAIDAIFAAARAFFDLPQGLRDALDVHRSPNFRGYVPMGFKGSGVPQRLLEAFQIMLELGPDDPDVRAGSVMHGPNVWPEDGPEFSADAFRAAMERYFHAVWRFVGAGAWRFRLRPRAGARLFLRVFHQAAHSASPAALSAARLSCRVPAPAGKP